jgi:hypothetical protein
VGILKGSIHILVLKIIFVTVPDQSTPSEFRGLSAGRLEKLAAWKQGELPVAVGKCADKLALVG